MTNIKWIKNRSMKDLDYYNGLFNTEAMEKVFALHNGIKEYQQTPVYELTGLSGLIGVGRIFVKDEANRMGLSSFKVLGGSYVVGRTILNALHAADIDYTFKDLHVRNTMLKNVKFVTATDGNHGRGIAWAAGKLGYPVTIFMPKGSSDARVNHIQRLGAEVVVTESNYDDTVRQAAGFAQKNGYRMVQDTVCEGCTEPPAWIMQGYLTIMHELIGQLGNVVPTHIFLQVGVGAFAGAVAGFLKNYFSAEDMPVITVVEAQNSDCYYQSIKNNRLTSVEGDLETIMVGLACGEPNMIAWDILSKTADFFVTCPNEVAAHGMRVLGNPYCNDPRITSGESGAVTLGLLSLLGDRQNTLRKALGLNEDSTVLLINTEGDTDPQMYRDIVWNGRFQNTEGISDDVG